MKFFSSFSFKVILPYLVLGTILLLIFLVGLDEDNSLFAWLSVAGMLFCFLGGVVHIFWLKRPLNRVRSLLVQLTRGSIPSFSASGARDEIGDLEQNLEKLVGNLKSITSFTRAMAEGDFTGLFEKRSSEDEIGEALLSLKESLMASRRESESRRKEEEHRTWTAQGLARFSKLFREARMTCLNSRALRELATTEADIGPSSSCRSEETAGT
jgi:HAMP domain-containing protein